MPLPANKSRSVTVMTPSKSPTLQWSAWTLEWQGW